MIKDIPEDAHIKIIEFRAYNYKDYRNNYEFRGISSARCVLSNDLDSPLFQKKDSSFEKSGVIQLSKNKVKKIKCYSDDNSRIYSLRFLDKDCGLISSYDPINCGDNGTVYEIAANEDLIGLYGVRKDNLEYFTSFGFIVKVMTVE